MKQNIRFFIIAAAITLGCTSVNAQIFKKLKKKVENKIEKKVDDILDGEESAENTDDGPLAERASSMSVYDFTPGNTVIFTDSIQYDQVGQMPKYWKSGGTGSVVTFPNVQGKWLLLNAFTTYKLDTLFAMPENFTIEFDVLTRSNEVGDLNTLSFGFSTDNSVSGYEENITAQTEIQYHNEDIWNYSKDTDSYNSYDVGFLQNYANAIMHVAIEVDGLNMKVYLDQNKVLDSEMFDPGRTKYFFINPSTRFENDAEIAISNFVVAK